MRAPQYLSRSAVLGGFAEAARDAGLDPHDLLMSHDFPPGCLDDPDLRLPTAGVLRLLEDAAALGNEPSFGLRMAALRDPSVLGAIGLVMRQQADVRGALHSLSRLGWAQIDGLPLAIEDNGDMALLSLSLAPDLPRPARQGIELTLAAVVRLLQRIISPDWTPEMVMLAHPRPDSIVLHQRSFGGTPLFAMDRNALVVRSDDLGLPIRGSDPVAARQLERYLAAAAGSRNASMTERTGQIIARLLPDGRCRIEYVTRQFGIDRRTLHRRLAAEGTTFTRLLEQTRRQLLLEYRSGGVLSATQIGDLLGFSGLSAYSRWKRGKG